MVKHSERHCVNLYFLPIWINAYNYWSFPVYNRANFKGQNEYKLTSNVRDSIALTMPYMVVVVAHHFHTRPKDKHSNQIQNRQSQRWPTLLRTATNYLLV